MIRLLIADDEKLEREALAELVQRRFEREVVLEMAENGRKAADTAVLWGADLILMDIEMPGMSGLEVQEHLLARKADLPIIFITGHGDVPMAVRALKKGAVDFIEKPFQQAALKAQVEHMLNEARERRMKNERQSLNEALLAKLTPREQQVLERIVAGRLNKQIADDLGISIKTVEAHRASIMDKTNSGTVADLMRVVMDTSQPAKFLDGSQAAK